MPGDLDSLLDEFLTWTWEDNPVTASTLGVDGYDDRLGDLSAEAFERRTRDRRSLLTRFEAIGDDGLDLDEGIDRDLVVAALRGALIMSDWQEWRRQPGTYLQPALNGVFVLFLHRLRDEDELVKSACARLALVPQVLADGRANLSEELAPKLFVARAIGQCRAGIRYVRELLPAEVQDESLRARLAEAGETAARALEDFGTFLDDLHARAHGDYALGEERYSALLREKEMLGFGAAELRERGRRSYAALDEEMSSIAERLRGTRDWRAVMEELNLDHPESPEEMRATYEEWTARARDFLIERALCTMPAGEHCDVSPSPPFQRPVLAVASYQSPPAFKPSLRGTFFVPYPPDGTAPDEIKKRLQTNSRNSIPSVSVHEAYPGHHWHAVIRQQNSRAIRQAVATSYFSEGWALYTELMMREEGFFHDLRHELCQVDARIFRAARIVVDTSLHIGDMSVDEAVEFMQRNASLSEPTARAEVGRYCAWPTQAASYLTGSLEIERIRERFFEQERGSLRDFHDRLAGSGSLPIALAERAVLR